MSSVVSLPTVEELRAHVLKILCSHDALDPTQTPLWGGVMKRRGKPCGMFFEVKGPRLLRTQALWEADKNRLLFYDASGVRFAEVRLSEAPDPLKLVA
jgi:hypothetical protein